MKSKKLVLKKEKVSNLTSTPYPTTGNMNDVTPTVIVQTLTITEPLTGTPTTIQL